MSNHRTQHVVYNYSFWHQSEMLAHPLLHHLWSDLITKILDCEKRRD